jgi:hypothetical protein
MFHWAAKALRKRNGLLLLLPQLSEKGCKSLLASTAELGLFCMLSLYSTRVAGCAFRRSSRIRMCG